MLPFIYFFLVMKILKYENLQANVSIQNIIRYHISLRTQSFLGWLVSLAMWKIV